MDIMDTARLNIKRHREIKGLRQQDMADKLSMSLRSYQSLESGETKLDIERLERIAEVLEDREVHHHISSPVRPSRSIKLIGISESLNQNL